MYLRSTWLGFHVDKFAFRPCYAGNAMCKMLSLLSFTQLKTRTQLPNMCLKIQLLFYCIAEQWITDSLIILVSGFGANIIISRITSSCLKTGYVRVILGIARCACGELWRALSLCTCSLSSSHARTSRASRASLTPRPIVTQAPASYAAVFRTN